MILLAPKNVDAWKKQSFHMDPRKVTMASYVAHYLAVSSENKVREAMTYSLSILPYCHSVLVECIAFFFARWAYFRIKLRNSHINAHPLLIP